MACLNEAMGKGRKTLVLVIAKVTEFALCNEKIYLSPIIDLYNGEIISYKISKRPILKQVLDMVEDATRKIKKTCFLLFFLLFIV